MLVAVTGIVCAGKTRFLRQLSRYGFRTADVDKYIHRIYAPGRPGCAAVERAFGRKYLSPRGGVDRRRLGMAVFSDLRKLKRLDDAVRPLIAGYLERLSKRSGNAVVFVEMAILLYHFRHFSRFFDRVVFLRGDIALAQAYFRKKRWDVDKFSTC